MSRVVLVLLYLFASVHSSVAQSGSSDQVKAVFLFNFAKFVSWPDSAFETETTPFRFCIAGNSLQGVLEATLRGETVNNRAIVIRRLSGDENVQNCHLLYISGVQPPTLALLRAVGAAPVLTVGESMDFISNGGIIRLGENARRIRFEINPVAAERASLQISSRLLRLADVKRQGPNGN